MLRVEGHRRAFEVSPSDAEHASKSEGGRLITSRHYAIPTTNTPSDELDLTAPHEVGLDGLEPGDGQGEGGLEGFLANGEGDGGAFGRQHGKGVRRRSAFGGGVARRGCQSSKRRQGIKRWRQAGALG